MKLLIINGPNLNLTGVRQPEIYGADTLDEIMIEAQNYASSRDAEITSFQSNHEGDIIDVIHAAMAVYDGIVINAGAYSHYSYAIRDAIAACGIPSVEVHLSNVHEREPFRAISVIRDVCIGSIVGKGKQGYVMAIEMLLGKCMH